MEKIPAALAPPLRQYALDWLRVLAFCLLIPYHTGMFFVSWTWHLKNNHLSESLVWPMIFLSQWRMPLLFLISGAGVCFALGNRSPGQFARERLRRLLLPLVFGMLVIVPPQIYYERLDQGHQYASYLAFYATVLELKPYPQGNFSWHHLWFLPYILVFSLLTLPLFGYLGRAPGKRLTQQLTRPAALLLAVVPLLVSDVLLRSHWPTDQNLIADWANFCFSLLVFLYGFLIASRASIRQIIRRYRHWSLAVGLVVGSLLYGLYWIPDYRWHTLAGEVAYRLLKDVHIWSWLLAILGFGFRYLNFPSRLLTYANRAVYPFYLLHQTLIVALAYQLKDLPWSIPLKFILISVGTFAGSLVLYELVIRRLIWLRPLFGLPAGPLPSRRGRRKAPPAYFF